MAFNEEYDRNKEILEASKAAAEAMEKRILDGEPVGEPFINDGGEKIVVTITSENKYGYAVFRPGEDKPFYLVESQVLLHDLNKKTAHNGVALRYPGAKSMLQRNMVGLFTEYIKDPGFEGIYVSVQMPKNATMDVSQQMTGYYPEDAVTIFGATFHNEKVWFASYAQIIPNPKTGKPTLRIGTGGINPDGSPDYDTMIRMSQEAEMAKKFFGEPYMDEERQKEVIEHAAKSAESIFYDMYEGFSLPRHEGVGRSNLLMDAMNGRDISGYLENNGRQFAIPQAGRKSIN